MNVEMSFELKLQFENVMNAIELKENENEIQRQLGMLFYLYQEEVKRNKYKRIY